jgi:hypothetical protein
LDSEAEEKMSEKKILNDIMLMATQFGGRLWRNNSGRMQSNDGRWIQFGVASPGGSDLIGFMPVGGVPVFTAIEVKYGKTRTTMEQQMFVGMVKTSGGIAGIVRSVEEFEQLYLSHLD